MNLLSGLVLFPFVAALALLIAPKGKPGKAIGYISSAVILGATLYLLYSRFGGAPAQIEIGGAAVEGAMVLLEALVAAYVIVRGLSARKHWVAALAFAQAGMVLYLQFSAGQHAGILLLDGLSLLLALITGVVGSIICVYSFDYMEDFHAHRKDVKDRRGAFFLVLFAFIGAMFGLAFSDSLSWLYFFWELTTLCSFLLIGYAGTREATEAAFGALTLNLAGSLAFAFAMLYLASTGGADTLSGLDGMAKAAALLPAALIAVAALAKSAQMPFSSWLIGASIAPTPVSALLHSATMVNAGVYVLLRLAPVFSGSVSGALLSLIGGATFVLASGMAISQSDAKRVLAYSTVSNLGLIVACAGVGTYEAVWAAILLLMFHSAAKSLMFMSAGSVEHRIGGRDIDDMEGLAVRMPKTAFIMLVGIAGMFLAPFGMLISKWAALRAFIDASPILVGAVALGSGMTVFFWAKWMGKLVADTSVHRMVDEKVGTGEWAALSALTALTMGLCMLFPLASQYLVEPFVLGAYGNTAHLAQDNVAIMLLMLAAILVMPFSMIYYNRKRRHVPPYMCGVTAAGGHYVGSLGIERDVSLKNYCLEGIFGEKRLARLGAALCILLAAGMLLFSFGVKG